MSKQKMIEEIRGIDSKDLRQRLADRRKEQFELRFHGAVEQMARTSRHREVRREIARIMMVLGERERTQTAGGKP